MMPFVFSLHATRAHRLVLGLACVLGATCHAAWASNDRLSLAPIFTDHAVLQRDQPLPVWGRATPGSTVTVTLGRSTASGVADGAGQWQVTLPAVSTTKETRLLVASSTGETLVREQVALGDVWLCSGQSNIEIAVRQASNADDEIKRSADEGLRLFHVPRFRMPAPSEQFAKETHWAVASPQSVRDFSATCYYMGLELRRRADVPIGLIASSWGGSPIEEWLDVDALREHSEFDADLAMLAEYRRDPIGVDARATATFDGWLTERATRIGLPGESDIAVALRQGVWEDWGQPKLSDFDGTLRYRGTVTLTAEQARRASSLLLGAIDDIDRTWLNDVAIGTTAGWDTLRRYPLPAGTARAGQNTIDIVVLDTGGGGGLWGTTSRGVLLDDGTLIALDDVWHARAGAPLKSDPPPRKPWANGGGLASLHNGMIAPLGHYKVSGFVWYQGEANASRAAQYRRLLPSLIARWRERFDASLFMVVQLPNFGAMVNGPRESRWAEMREAQRQVVEHDAAARLIPTIDIGDPYDIHPANKRELGRRLALAATRPGFSVGTGIVAVRNGSDIDIALNGDFHLAGGVRAPIGFELCKAGGVCRYADARLNGTNRVLLAAEPDDVQVRYLWANSPLVSLFDADGMPLPPLLLTVR